MKTFTLSLTLAAALVATAPAFAFSVYQLETDGSTAHYLAPGAKNGSGLKLNDAPEDNSMTLYQDGDTSFSMSGGTTYTDGTRPNSLNSAPVTQSDPNAPFTGYYLRNR